VSSRSEGLPDIQIQFLLARHAVLWRPTKKGFDKVGFFDLSVKPLDAD